MLLYWGRLLSITARWICLLACLAACQPAAPQPMLPAGYSPSSIPNPPLPTPERVVEIASTQPPAATPTQAILASASATPERIPPVLPPFPPARVVTESADVWDDPRFENQAAHRQTQLILGEGVLVVQTRGDWAEIRAVAQPSHKDPLGYPGWVRRGSLVDGWPDPDRLVVVMAPSAPIYAQPRTSAARLVSAPLDTRLESSAQIAGWVSVRLPDGRGGWLESSAVRLTGPAGPLPAPPALLDTARSLAGIPYLWGGTAPAAYDCSGFVYRVFSANGVKIARDSQDQARMGIPLEPGDLRPGDLLFYSAQAGGPVTHVALYWGSQQVMDAQTSRGVALHPMAEVLGGHVFVTARRLLPYIMP